MNNMIINYIMRMKKWNVMDFTNYILLMIIIIDILLILFIQLILFYSFKLF